MLDQNEVQVIRLIVADVLEVESIQVTGDANFITDLGADSLRVIEVLTRVELEFGTSIHQSYLARMVSLDSVCGIVSECQLSVA